MSYEVIARKWRPQQFDQIIGQGHVTQTLKNEISNGRIAHAFLFSGTRGVGKTTTARILAKALNCRKDDKPNPIPCEICGACVEIKRGAAVDVLEIDAASNRGIDEIRELRESVKYAPAKLRYKVYIIDEVHMLTREAFNALLKTLEEPPQHVVFILATTDVHKVPITILSRCQRFDFRRVSLKELTASLRHVVESESVQIDEQSLVYIAKTSEGSIRDAQSLLDQMISYSGTQIHHEDVQTLLGVIGQETLKRFAEVILSKKAQDVFQLVENLTLHGYDLGHFCKELIEYFRNLVIIKLVPNPETLVEDISLDLKSLKELVSTISLQELQQIFKFLLETESELKRTSYPRFALEMALVRATQLASLQPLELLLEKIRELEEKLAFSLDSEPQKSPERLEPAIDLFSGSGSHSKPRQPPSRSRKYYEASSAGPGADD
ncbi:MAG: DNA polymerase III subunit gamma/tau [Nitrospira sp.]|nr:DNA polymerase III subunit gamma/tau [Nitrospira sp.]